MFATAAPASGAGPNVLLVGPSGTPGATFTSIQAAVNAANPGDWVLVAPGVYHEKGYSPTDGSAPAAVKIDKALHLRGMDRAKVIVDVTQFSASQAAGTLPAGSPACSNVESLQDPGVLDTSSNRHTREGVLAVKTAGVSVENLSVCNSMDNQIWWNNGDGSGVQGSMSLHGDYITATSTFYKDASSPSASYGIFTSNIGGPNGGPLDNVIDHSYANNMTDSSYYIGACRVATRRLSVPRREQRAGSVQHQRRRQLHR